MSAEAAFLGTSRALVGESAWWDAGRNTLWSVDVQGKELWQTSPRSGHARRYQTPEMAGGVFGRNDGMMVAALETGLFLFHPERARALALLSRPDDLPSTHRFNDLTVDQSGALIVGTMKKSQIPPAEATGILYRFDGMSWSILARGFYTINGLAVSPDGKTLYWSDSYPAVRKIWCASYDAAGGKLGEPRLFVDMRGHRGRPDGAAIDALGGYWIAAIGGGCLHRFLPDGRLDRTIELPVEHPTKPAFGADGLRTLFITSLSIRPSAQRADLAGAIVTIPAPFAGLGVPAFTPR